ncbi:hypothetical protein [Infirmifilum sp. NZ]|uniref:hypothetical protein n=1 Tax=Infirmifilum sp. NZ TaxID=2926850 RepID=UPI00269D1D88|nr:hypothetical protein [Infirmifilum sp. NZ]UNQ73199.1 hypothetical protein MOV14_08815 [Infirmifilum sp. NZ]
MFHSYLPRLSAGWWGVEEGIFEQSPLSKAFGFRNTGYPARLSLVALTSGIFGN